MAGGGVELGRSGESSLERVTKKTIRYVRIVSLAPATNVRASTKKSQWIRIWENLPGTRIRPNRYPLYMHATDGTPDTDPQDSSTPEPQSPAGVLRNRRATTGKSKDKKPPLGAATPADTAKPEPPADAPTPNPSAQDTEPEPPMKRPEVGNRIDKLLRDSIEYARQHLNTSAGDSMLDESIFAMRKRGLSIPEIARHFQGTLSEQDVEQRIARQLANFAALSTSEYRALQVARLEDVINMCYDYARGGSEEHVKMLLLAIERLNKMFELESTKTQIEINLVTSQQSSLILAIMDAITRIVLTNPQVSKALEMANIEQEVIDGITGEALDVATEQLINAQHSMLEIDLSQETSRVIEAIN